MVFEVNIDIKSDFKSILGLDLVENFTSIRIFSFFLKTGPDVGIFLVLKKV